MIANEDSLTPFDSSSSFISGHAPEQKDVQFSIGPYQILGHIGQGGMGEVLLAYDPKCGRRIALKKIRKDLTQHSRLQNRFLKEARITSQLTHPAIMPIYAIEDEDHTVYYTMPFVQGETLKQILRKTREQEKTGEDLHHIGGSIPALIRIFITVCQATAYAHSKGVLHRDLKPENIMVGKYGEVLILDWGLAKLIGTKRKGSVRLRTDTGELTQAGKVVGTISYMAPERAKGEPATILTEIYALGVILYQLLTLRSPFRRGTLEEFRKKMDRETYEDPLTAAPYRDIPRLLARIATKCMETDPSQRYYSVTELLKELEDYIEGRSEWFLMAKLDIHQKADWEFQENVLIAEHIAITRSTDLSEWVSLMISKGSFTENTKIEARVTIGDNGRGIGFLMSIPESAEREHLNDGYCLWIGSDLNKTTKLLRSTVEVEDAPEIFLERGKPYIVTIEKIDNNIYFSLNGQLQFSYISPLPLIGTHIGLLSRDADFTIEDLTVYVGSLNVTLNCLAVPDAFLAHKQFDIALSEYRRIGYSFPGRAEGREAMFRAGITILEKAKSTRDTVEKDSYYEEALLEFEKLHSTPGAPLEYLGKAHVYQTMLDYEEEIKCYEIGFRRYQKHPLLPVLEEQLLYRMHEMSRIHRKAAYRFMLTALKHLPETSIGNHTRKLFSSLQKYWEPLHFVIVDPGAQASDALKNIDFGIRLSFWLANPFALAEAIEALKSINPLNLSILSNGLFCLIELGAWKQAKEVIEALSDDEKKSQEILGILIALLCHQKNPQSALEAFFLTAPALIGPAEARIVLHIAETALKAGNTRLVHEMAQKIQGYEVAADLRHFFDNLSIWAHLYDHNWLEAGALLHRYPLPLLTHENSLLFTLYGILLAATEGPDISYIHFSGVLDTAFPRTWCLLAYSIIGKITEGGSWEQRAFLWEKRQLYSQLALYYRVLGNVEQEQHFKKLEQEHYL